MQTRLRIALVSGAGVLCLTLTAIGSRTVTAQAPPKPMLRASLSPAAVPAGSAQSLSFVLTALGQADGTMSLRIPAAAAGSPWTAPQVGNPSAPGWVAVQNGTCQSAKSLRLSPT